MNARALISTFILFPVFALAADYSTWSYYRDITLNPVTAGATADESNYPILLRFNKNSAADSTGKVVFSQAMPAGQDVRFTAVDHVTDLAFEIVTWDTANGTADLFVKIPLLSGTANTVIRMYCGKAGSTTASSGATTFSNGFDGVFHLSEAAGIGINDASGHGITGAITKGSGTLINPIDSVTTSPGTYVLSHVKDFQGSGTNFANGGFFALNNGAASGDRLDYLNAVNTYTISAWILMSSSAPAFGSGSRPGIISKVAAAQTGSNAAAAIQYDARAISNASIEITDQAGSSGSVSANGITAGTWHYMTIVRSVAGSPGTLSKRNTPASSGGLANAVASSSATAAVHLAANVAIGGYVANGAGIWPGQMSEVEFSSVPRSDNWLTWNFQTQKPGQTVVTYGIITMQVMVPGAPTGVAGIAGNGQVAVSWTAPTFNGGGTITAYAVTSTPGSFTCATTGGTSCTVVGLTNGNTYTFTVTATNSAGTGSASVTSPPVTLGNPVNVPGQPPAIQATAGNAQAVVAWAAPGSPGGSAISNYIVTSNPDGKTCTTTTAVTCTVTTLANGIPYTFTVVAINSFGAGLASPPSTPVTPIGQPSAPTGVTGVAGNAQVVVSWTAPFNGGSAITGYTVTSAPGNFTCTTTGAITCPVSGLNNGTPYTFTVVARNSIGPGAASAPSAAITPVTVPGAPTNATGVAGDGQVAVSWVAPTSTGGTPITGYTVTASGGGGSCTTTSLLTCTVTFLASGTAYTFTVTATNAVGTGAASLPSASVTTGIAQGTFKDRFGIRVAGSTVTFQIPHGLTGSQISVMDIWGRTVWSQRVTKGENEITWNGTSERGSSVARGIYLVRLASEGGNNSGVLAEPKITLLP